MGWGSNAQMGIRAFQVTNHSLELGTEGDNVAIFEGKIREISATSPKLALACLSLIAIFYMFY